MIRTNLFVCYSDPCLLLACVCRDSRSEVLPGELSPAMPLWSHCLIRMQGVVVTNLIWGFEFSPALDESGKEIKPDIWNYTEVPLLIQTFDHGADSLSFPRQALGSAPYPFRCTVKPRSAHHAAVIRSRFVEATPHLQAFEHEISDEDRIVLERMRAEAAKV